VNDNDTSAVSGLSKSDLVLEFWAFRQMFLSRIRYLGPKDGCAEDIFQEACVRFLASRAVFVHPGAATRYFCRTLRSLVADHFKHQARIQYLEDLPELMCNPWQTYCLQENAASVWKAAKRLPVRDRQLLHVYINRHAHKLFRQIPRSTLGYRTTKVRRKLRRMIGAES
jgi:DNA-directed RNA polymerase specialized sigma24 family protein